jgi:hypothetical protein
MSREKLTIARADMYGNGMRPPTQAELDSYMAVHAYLQLKGCEEPVRPQVRTLVDDFNDLVDPATAPFDQFRGLGCCPGEKVNRAAELYASAKGYFDAARRYYEERSTAPQAPATVEDRIAAIETQLSVIAGQLDVIVGGGSVNPDGDVSNVGEGSGDGSGTP